MNSEFKLRDYQVPVVEKGYDVISEYGFLYLAMEVRTGKSITSMSIVDLFKDSLNIKNVLFLTKKKAMVDVQPDYELMNPSWNLTLVNYESCHKVPATGYDFIIFDEAHTFGAFPKPSKRAKDVREFIRKNDCPVILMSGTPSPESYSQLYHQVFGIPGNPFKEYANFYKFAKDYVNVKQIKMNTGVINDYKDGSPEILEKLKPMTISLTQKEAGFDSAVEEEVLHVRMSDLVYNLARRLSRDRVVEGSEHVILADTPAKLMQKLHQIYSGTVRFEPEEGDKTGHAMVLDESKAKFIKDRFEGKKIAIFYKFREELTSLMVVFGNNKLTTDLEEFNSSDKSIALQIVSGREGISLRNATDLVFMNIDFSATSYWQARDRMTTKDRAENKVWWVFSERGIEDMIYKRVMGKKDYTLAHFKKDFGVK